MVEGVFELLESRKVGRLPTKKIQYLDWGPEPCEGIDFQDLKRLNAPNAAVGILLEECVQNATGLIAILGEEIALLNPFGTFPTGERRPVEGNMADEIKGVVVTPYLLGEFVEEDSLGGASSSRMAAFFSASLQTVRN